VVFGGEQALFFGEEGEEAGSCCGGRRKGICGIGVIGRRRGRRFMRMGEGLKGLWGLGVDLFDVDC
jgi:hypothetical protein